MNLRVFNFSAGPGKLPASVLKEIRDELLSFKGSGMSIMEFGHRHAVVQDLILESRRLVKSLMRLNDDYDVLFLQGGGSLQFVMVPMNLSKEGEGIDYVDTGYWARRAVEEAKHLKRNVRIVASSVDGGYTYIPEVVGVRNGSAYVHLCSNNTIFGTQWGKYPSVAIPIVADMSSDIMSRVVDPNEFGCIYAHAQKTIGTAGVTMVIVKREMVERVCNNLPLVLSYKEHIRMGSIFNTPPVFAIYVVWKMLKWIECEMGGIENIEKMNRKKAGELYGYIDANDFYNCPVDVGSRSMMNVVIRLPSVELEKRFVKKGSEDNFVGLEGHRSVGGIRASIYNSVTEEDVSELVGFMKEFERKAG